jgi:ribosome maturation factor RimP
MTIESQLEALVLEILGTDPSYFLVEIRIKPTNNVKVFLDGDNGISIEKCIAVNRAMYKRLEGSGMFPNDDFSLEVSSPGLDEPLKLHRQYLKNKGRKVEVLQKDGIKVEGTMLEVSEQSIELEEIKGKNKKQEIIRHVIPFESIKSTKIQIVF